MEQQSPESDDLHQSLGSADLLTVQVIAAPIFLTTNPKGYYKGLSNTMVHGIAAGQAHLLFIEQIEGVLTEIQAHLVQAFHKLQSINDLIHSALVPKTQTSKVFDGSRSSQMSCSCGS
jgi:hypothetical protein